VLRRLLGHEAEFSKDIGILFTFAAAAADPTAPTLVAALGLVLQAAGSAISAGLAITRGLWKKASEESLPPFECFNSLFLLTTIRAYMEALSQILSEEIGKLESSEDGRTRKAGHKDDAIAKQAFEEALLRAKDVNDADLTYLFGVEPLRGDVPLLKALREWLTASLAALGMRPFEVTRIADACDEAARLRFHVFLSGDSEEGRWMRRFLALESQSEQQKTLNDLSDTLAAIQGWLVERDTAAGARDTWVEYRQRLRQLPDLKDTMFNEDFGVSQVFQAPRVQYHVAGARGEAGEPHTVEDVGRLLGALVSTRTEGQDLIILSGGPGSGKSTLCRVFASELARSEESHPIFLQLRRVKEGADIGQFVEDALQKGGLIGRISELLKLPNVVLILDGFDELVAANRSRLRQFFNALLVDVQTGPLRNAHVVVSGRDTLFPGGQGLPAGSHVVDLQPFDRTRVTAWGNKWRNRHSAGPGCTFHPEHYLPEHNESADSSVTSPLEHLVRWPLTLHLVARVHTAGGLPTESEGGAKIDKAYLYRSILAETSTRQSEAVAGAGRLEPKAMRAFLRAVAWLMYTQSVDSLDVADVTPLLSQVPVEGEVLDTSQIAEVAILNAPELAKGEETGFEFVHKSFSEFLAAENIAERVERVSFMVPEFGSKEPAWRMSTAEASTALAEVLGIRLLTEEIQEMLEPMLGAVLPFREGTKVEEAVPLSQRVAGLRAVLRRCEGLYANGVGGALELGRVEDVVKDAPGVGSVLEGLANYIVGLALLGCAAAGQLSRDPHGVHERFGAEPEPGAIWRFVALAHAGGIAIDGALARRLFPRMSVRGPSESEDYVVSDVSVPWKLHLLTSADGYESQIEPAVAKAVSTMQLATRLVLLLVSVLQEQLPRESGVRRLSARLFRRRERMYFSRGDLRLDGAVLELCKDLARLGVISPELVEGATGRFRGDGELDRLFRHMADGVERSRMAGQPPPGPLIDWRPIFEQLVHYFPIGPDDADLVQLVAEVLDDRDAWMTESRRSRRD
jgi:hypothetical protein